MLRGKYLGVTPLCLCLCAGALAAQTHTGTLPRTASQVIARSGGYRLTEQMIEQAFQLGQILAAKDFSPSDAAALRTDLIAYFQEEPAKQTEAYESVAQWLQRLGIPGRKPSWLALAIARNREWQSYADPQRFREFQSYPFGKMVLKYNPALIDSGGMVVTKNDVECQFSSDTLVAKAAGVAPPTEAYKDRFIRNLPSRFASLPKEQQEQLTKGELRLASLDLSTSTPKAHAAMLADIRKNVRSSADVWREARRVENDALAKYRQLWSDESVAGVVGNVGSAVNSAYCQNLKQKIMQQAQNVMVRQNLQVAEDNILQAQNLYKVHIGKDSVEVARDELNSEMAEFRQACAIDAKP